MTIPSGDFSIVGLCANAQRIVFGHLPLMKQYSLNDQSYQSAKIKQILPRGTKSYRQCFHKDLCERLSVTFSLVKNVSLTINFNCSS